MGSVFRKSYTKPLPAGAEVVDKNGQRVARWRVRGKLRSAPLTAKNDGPDRLLIEGRTYFAKYRDHAGAILTRPIGCKDEQTARQVLAKWEREVEPIKAGTLDRRALDTARLAAVPLEQHLVAYERSLLAAEVSVAYRVNVLRAVRRVANDCAITAPADLGREAVEGWLAARVGEGMSARSRNDYRESLVAFTNWCVRSGRLGTSDLHQLQKPTSVRAHGAGGGR